MNNIYNYTQEELQKYFLSKNDKKYRAEQIYDFLYKKRVKTLEEMTNIGKKTIEELKKDFDTYKIKLVLKQEDTNVKKYLFELIDGQRIESVLMYHDYGISICISSQVGCNMGCKFCESGRLKKVRNLEAYEMVEQILIIEEDIFPIKLIENPLTQRLISILPLKNKISTKRSFKNKITT